MALVLLIGAGLLIASVGTYTVMSYAVSRRTHEIGVRMALGAGRSEIARMVLGDGLRLALIGVSMGAVIAFSAAGLLRHLLVGVGQAIRWRSAPRQFSYQSSPFSRLLSPLNAPPRSIQWSLFGLNRTVGSGFTVQGSGF